MAVLIQRQDVTTADGTTPEGGVYITVKLAGVVASIFDVNGNPQANPFQSAIDGTFSYYVTAPGTYIEEYRFNLADAPRTIEAVQLALDTTAAALLATNEAIAAASSASQAQAAQAAVAAMIGSGGPADSNLRTDLVANTGATLVGWLASWTGAVFRKIADKLTDTVSAKDFGVVGDSVVDTTPNLPVLTTKGTDNRGAFQAALNYISSSGGGTLRVPAGAYYVSNYLTVPKNCRIVGAGQKSSIIVTDSLGGGGATAAENLRNGSILYGYFDTGSSVSTRNAYEHLSFVCTNANNRGAAIYDNNGTNWSVRNCHFKGFWRQLVIDYSELVDIDKCDFQFPVGTTGAGTEGAGVWIVNGASLTTGHQLQVTNRVTVSACQFNGLSNASGIIDDGGYTHAFRDNNYNALNWHIFAVGVQSLNIDGGEFEAPTAAACIFLGFQRFDDAGGVGGGYGKITNALISPGGTVGNYKSCVQGSSGTYKIGSNALLSNPSVKPILGTFNRVRFDDNLVQSTDNEIISQPYGNQYYDTSIDGPVISNSGLASQNIPKDHSGKFVQCTNATGNSQKIMADATTAFRIGTLLRYEQTTSGGTVTMVADTGVTLTGTLTTAAQYDYLECRKVAANSWRVKRR